jgi:ribose-phosphate pyrophosphokinase
LTAAGEPILFALEASRPCGETIAAALGIALSAHEERGFEDGEHKARPLVSVRGRDVFVVHSLYGEPGQSVNDKLCRLLFFLGAIRDASAGSVTVVAPYLCYARKDRRTKFRDPVTTRYVAQLFEAVGVDRVVTLDVHNLAAFQNAFRCRTEHLEARMLFVKHFAPMLRDGSVVVLSPDEGGLKRVNSFRYALGIALGREVPSGFMEKHRSRGVVSGEALYADVKDRTVLILDDLISSGTTLLRAAEAARAGGAKKVYAAASHGLFMPGAEKMLANPALSSVVVTDTVSPFRLDPALAQRKLTVLTTAPLVAEAIRRIYSGASIAELMGPEE